MAGLADVVRPASADQTELMPTRRYTDVRGIAAHLAITERHVRRLVLERRIPHRKMGHLLRFDMGEIDRWMDTFRRGPALEASEAASQGARHRPRTA